MRHRLVLPKPPAPSTPSAQPANTVNGAPTQNTSTPAEDVLTFFSLYMHTLPLDGYGAAKALRAYYGATDIYTVGNKANDPRKNVAGSEDHNQPGLRVRASHTAGSAVTGWLARDTKIKVGQKHGAWGKIGVLCRVRFNRIGKAQPCQQMPRQDGFSWASWTSKANRLRWIRSMSCRSLTLSPQARRLRLLVSISGSWKRGRIIACRPSRVNDRCFMSRSSRATTSTLSFRAAAHGRSNSIRNRAISC
ncbi:hypothetical protein BCAR13_280001 [Paraburkholderia caribensis]|nr:hypothetical protein BCAR13_280001 [Paraburkholderia caribensis]